MFWGYLHALSGAEQGLAPLLDFLGLLITRIEQRAVSGRVSPPAAFLHAQILSCSVRYVAIAKWTVETSVNRAELAMKLAALVIS